MHGIVYFLLQQFVESSWDNATWTSMFETAGLERKTYLPTDVYPDAEILALVEAGAKVADASEEEVLTAFGRFLAPNLMAIHGALIHPEWRTLETILNTEEVMHTMVRQSKPGAQPPVLKCVQVDDNTLQIIYTSPRKLCPLAKGIMQGIADHFGETIRIDDQSCMLNGDFFCSMSVAVVSASGETHGVGATPASKSDVPQRDRPQRLGEYRIIKLLGEGGMGEVFEAEDTQLLRRVALKVLKTNLADRSKARERFLREARAVARIQHEHIVPIYQVGEDAGRTYLVMPLLEGNTLDVWRAQQSKLTLEQIVRYAKEVVDGLQAAHQRGVIHRDIKPSNLWMASPDDKLRIMDFGLARPITGGDHSMVDESALTQQGVALGTPGYMSPEQLDGKEIDERSDLYSVGVVLYWLCSGHQPYPRAKTFAQVVRAMATESPQLITTLSPDVPDQLAALIMQCLSQEADDRPASADELFRSFEKLDAELKASGKSTTEIRILNNELSQSKPKE